MAFLALTSTLRADVFELEFSIEPSGFMGYWRFADGRALSTIGRYNCTENMLTETVNGREVVWYHGACDVIIKPKNPNTAQAATFEIKALHAIIEVMISGSNRIAFPEGQTPTPTISLAAHETGGAVTINTSEVTIEPNGFPGNCGFEYILNDTGHGRNSCDGQPTVLPLGTTFQLFAAGREANPVHISHWGIPYPEGNGRVYRVNDNTVAFRTVDVTIAPFTRSSWHIEGVTPASTWMIGTQTLRLVQNNLYNLAVDIGKKEPAGALFKLEPRCGTPAQTVYVHGYGFFYITQMCSP